MGNIFNREQPKGSSRITVKSSGRRRQGRKLSAGGNYEKGGPAFPVRRHPSLGSLDSFVLRSRHQGSTENELVEGFDSTALNRDGGGGGAVRRSHGSSAAARRSHGSGGANTNRLTPPTTKVNKRASGDSIPSLTSKASKKTTRTQQSKKRKRRNAHDQYDIHTQYYAGIGHSDLDIQTGRPPLMHQMSFLEWLWFQSGSGQRFLFMLVGVLLFIALCHLLWALYMFFSPDFKHDPYHCHTKQCIYLAKRLRSTLNRSVNPCEDFYGFVCGSSDIPKEVTQEEDEEWNYGFDVGRIVYDFRYSPSLGRMLSKMDNKPASLVLDMYKPCLDHKTRNSKKLEPYYEVLEAFQLDKVSLSAQPALTGENVVKSMAKILSHSFLTSAILKVQFYKNEAGAISAYIERAITEPILAGPTFRYGYKLYHDTVHTAFSRMKNELHITEEELAVLPHDIICMELFFRDEYTEQNMKSVIDDEANVGHKPCEIGSYSGTRNANFGQAPSGYFDFELLIRLMFKIGNEKWNEGDPLTPFGTEFEDVRKDKRTDIDLVNRFSEEFKKSAPIRFLRYMQWRVFYKVALDLDEDTLKLMINVERHHYLGKFSNCFDALFYWLPFLAPHTFLKNSGTNIDILQKEFEKIEFDTVNVYKERANLSIIQNVVKYINSSQYPDAERQKTIIDNIIKNGLRVDSIPPVDFTDKNFKRFRELYTEITFKSDQHIKNILKMGLRIHRWKTSPEFADIFYGIKSSYRARILFDKSIRNYDRIGNKYRMFLPMALTESPFSQDGLRISDLSGLGMEIAGNLETTFYSSLVYEVSQAFLHDELENKTTPSPLEPEVDAMEDAILKYHDELKKQFTSQIAQYKVGNKQWNHIKYNSSMDQILTTALHEQSQFQALSVVVDRYLKNSKTPWQERKSTLEGLVDFTLRQIFYIALVNRRCEKIGQKEFAQIYEYGPLPQSIRNNLALSNVDEFAETFNCPPGSPMNRKDKVYFWRRDFNKK